MLGTFDNSICNAAVLAAMLEGLLPPNAVVAFTGNEEYECKGAAEVAGYLKRKERPVWNRLELAIVSDITSEGYGMTPFTIENYSAGSAAGLRRILHFSSDAVLKKYLQKALSAAGKTLYIRKEDSDPDETLEYCRHGLNCLTFCIPSRPHPSSDTGKTSSWMHDDRGIIIRKKDYSGYMIALSMLCLWITVFEEV